MSYPADPGGVFASDAHRRVLGHLPVPEDESTGAGSLTLRMDDDAHTDFTETDELIEVLKDLEADGHAAEGNGGWKMTTSGFNALNSPPEGADNG